MEIHRIAAFTDGAGGGNPAGVALSEALPADPEMLRIAAEIGYSETAFVSPEAGGFRVRYFAPEAEVSFCGHATIASAALLGQPHGPRHFRFELNDASIEVEARERSNGVWEAAFRSPATRSRPASEELIAEVLGAFGLTAADLEPSLPIALASAGANHLLIALRTRAALAAMRYPFEPIRGLMTDQNITTICLIWRESVGRYHARNAFAFGGVYEDPATGAAAAAFGGYLRDLSLTDPGRIEILQGHDMGQPCRLVIELDGEPGAGVRVGGGTRTLAPAEKIGPGSISSQSEKIRSNHPGN